MGGYKRLAVLVFVTSVPASLSAPLPGTRRRPKRRKSSLPSPETSTPSTWLGRTAVREASPST